MAYHWQIRQGKFTKFKTQAIDFYIRRFFRIAPLYYLLLMIAFLGQDFFIDARHYIRVIVPPPWAGLEINHINPTDNTISISNILSHYMFIFGLFPKYAANNALPDWSIGLEMQFYLIFPFIIFLISRFGAFSIVSLLLIASMVTNRLLGLYLIDGPLGNFPQPSFILFKIDIFLAGICLAYAYMNRKKVDSVPWLFLGTISLALSSAIQIKLIALLMVFVFFFDNDKIELIHRIGSGKLAQFMGDTSYSVYLLHLLILFPVLYVLFHYEWFNALNQYMRLVVSMLAIGIPVYSISFLLFRVIELPGITFGKKILKDLRFQKIESKVVG
jgi:peptidoglycan/LPS O-acetylase OafA/YrhL